MYGVWHMQYAFPKIFAFRTLWMQHRPACLPSHLSKSVSFKAGQSLGCLKMDNSPFVLNLLLRHSNSILYVMPPGMLPWKWHLSAVLFYSFRGQLDGLRLSSTTPLKHSWKEILTGVQNWADASQFKVLDGILVKFWVSKSDSSI